jgi:glutamate 5-kinase
LKQSERNYKRIVIKIGSSLLCHEREIDFSFIEDISSQIAGLIKEKIEVIIVSSGAIAFGMTKLSLESRPKELSYLQAVAAIGQHELMNVYRDNFKNHGLCCAQLLLTREDLHDRRRYLNAKNTLLTLLKLKAVPIINENDTVSVDEIKFGDNDQLSAMVSGLISADLLIMLSDVDGLLDKDKKVISLVEEITPQIKALACPTSKKTCVGGMITKIEAAKITTDSGSACVIANGRRKGILSSVLKESVNFGTLFLSNKNLAAKKRWIAFGARPKGKIYVDDGAKKALLNNKSLLSVGIVNVEGDFTASSTASVLDAQGNEFARGKVNISSRQLEKVKGTRQDKEVIHRDNIVIL